MKSIIAKLLRPVLQSYANFLITRLENCNLYEYEIFMSQAVLLDYVAVEEFDIYLD